MHSFSPILRGTVGFFSLCLLLLASPLSAVTIGFTAGEGYSGGALNGHADWEAHNNFVVSTAGTGTVVIYQWNDAIYGPGEATLDGDVFETSVTFTFTAANTADATAAANKPLVNTSFFSTSTGGNKLAVGLTRAGLEYAINLHTTWNSTTPPPFTGGAVTSGGVTATSVGVNRDGDLETDLLKLRMRLTRGVTINDWTVTGYLYNVSDDPDTLLTQFTATGVTFDASTVYGGFGAGQSDINARVTNRIADDFTFEKTSSGGASPPPPLTPPAPGAGPADVNQNGIPDLAELYDPAVAQFPPAEDTDGDGRSNLEEITAGTDPFDAASFFRMAHMAATVATPDSADFIFGSVPGVRYEIQISKTLLPGSWSAITNEVLASDALTTVSYDMTTLGPENYTYFRAQVLPSPDSDGDGLENSLELYLGFATDSASSVRSAAEGGDYEQFFQLMAGASPDGGVFHAATPGIPSDEQAARFLAQATMGTSQQAIDDLRALGSNAFELWIDQQVALPANSFASPYLDLTSARRLADYNTGSANWDSFAHRVDFQSYWADYLENLQTVWTRLALFAPDELRQRSAWGLSQIMVGGPDAFSHARGQAEWYDTCVRNSLGSYRTLLYEIAVNPWMGKYLSHEGNLKADPTLNRMPDENFAREIMQLFSIGLWELNMDGTRKLDVGGDPISTYDNDDITQVARVFTGLTRNFSEYTGNSQDIFSTAPMNMIANKHDEGDATMASVYGAGEKTFLQGPFYTPTPLPTFANDPGRTGLDDVNDTIDILFNHPNTPPFISKRLISHFVTSNPTPAYVERIANVFVDDGVGTRGNLAAVVKAILLDEEARGASAMLADNSGRMKAPMLRYVTLCRAYQVGAATPAIDDLTGIEAWNPDMEVLQEDFKQAPHQYPSVFNFYEPGYARPGEIDDADLLSPEFQILDSSTAISVPNRLWTAISDGYIHEAHPDAAGITPATDFNFGLLSGVADDTGALLDELNVLICQGRLSAASRSIIATAVDNSYAATTPNRIDRIKLATYLVTISHDGTILK